MKNFKLLATLGVSALLLTACSGGGSSEGGSDSSGSASGETVTLHAATMVQPNTPNAPVENWFYDQLEERSNGRIVIDRTEPESICPAQEIAECVRDGRADVGTSISDYTPQLFPSLTVVSVPFLTNNSTALMEALYRVNTENADAVAKWEEIGLKYVASWGPGKLILGTNDTVDSVADVSGVRYRVTGGFLQRAFEQAGANVVALTAGETYEGIERGVADAIAWTVDGPVDFKMVELLSEYTDPGVGHYTAFSTWMNQETYDSLDDELKAVVDEVIEELNTGAGMEAFAGVTDAQCTSLLEHPNFGSFTAWDESATNEWRDQVQESLLNDWASEAEKNGLANAQAYIDEYRETLDKLEANPDLVPDPVAACIDRANG